MEKIRIDQTNYPDYPNREKLYELIKLLLENGYEVCIYANEFDNKSIRCFVTIKEFIEWKKEQEKLLEARNEIINKIKNNTNQPN